MQLLPIFTFIFASGYVLLLDYIALSQNSLQKALVVVLVTILFMFYRFSRHSWKELTTTKNKLFFILWATIFVQLLIISTGGLKSPFLVIIHLFMLGLSLLFSFSFALFFLASSLVVIAVDISFSQSIYAAFLKEPTSFLLLVSFIPIVPLAYILSQQYHAKDMLFGFLKTKIATDEAIFQSISEMIVITDENLRILAVNDSTSRTLQRSRSELLEKPLFDVLLLKDEEGKLVTKNTLFPTDDATTLQTKRTFTLMQSPIPERKITIQIQPVAQDGEKNKQISFIISFVNSTESALAITLDKARARYEALMQNLKNQSKSINLLLLEKVEQDTYVLQALQTERKNQRAAYIDLAQLGKQIVLINQSFADALHVRTTFNLQNFGQKDIAPLTIANYPVEPEQLTGPFFTALCDVKNIELISKKLFDLAILLASTENNAIVELNVERGNKQTIILEISASAPQLTQDTINELFIPYYGKLFDKTNLHIGSGLEGFLVKHLTDRLGLSLKTRYNHETSHITFQINIPKQN